MTDNKLQVHRPPASNDVHFIAAVRIEPHQVAKDAAGAHAPNDTILILQDERATHRRISEG
jgi:hypothetical protein